MRRNAHSCDQCRRSKRACDAPPLKLPDGFRSNGAALLSGNLQPPNTAPCSYCKKTSKNCTMQWAWQQLQLHAAVDAVSRGELNAFDKSSVPSKRSNSNEDEEISQSSRSPFEQPENQGPNLSPGNLADFPFPGSMAQTPSMMPTPQSGEASLYTGNLPGGMSGNDLFSMPPHFNTLPEESTVPGIPDMDFPFQTPMVSADPMDGSYPYTFTGNLSPSSTGVTSNPLDQVGSDFVFSVSGQSNDMLGTPLDTVPRSSNTDYSTRSTSFSENQPMVKRQRFSPQAWASTAKPSMSPFSIDQNMMKLCTQGIISENLLKIYHDVLEHNLSCWVTEATCPYKGARCIDEGRKTAEWGPSWSNRIFTRTMKLDAASKAAGLVRTTRAQDASADRAMHMAIMAFATQWAQGSRRKDEQYKGKVFGSMYKDPEDTFSNMADEFDRDLQRHFWNEAVRALNAVSDVESYQVIAAEIVFGFSQKPWTRDDIQGSVEEAQKVFQSESSFDMSTLQQELSRCIDKDGPPVYLERAARKVHALKFRTDAAAKGIAKRQGIQPNKAQNQLLSFEDQRTAGLLYWLTVMADTISSSMNERPITVKDEDSQHDLVTITDGEMSDGRWKVELFIKDKLENPTMNVTWPCDYESAAEAITNASPVKILLFRHVGYLQSMLRRGQTGLKLEDIIRSSMLLWNYWNSTHGQFFRELVDDFENVPTRVRGWFFCISAHWHLAALMVIELCEFVDEEHLGLPEQRERRIADKSLATMKEISVRELSDLARISLPPSETDIPPASMLQEGEEFHHAVNEGTILTEPWTIVLIRAFSHVTTVILKDVDSYNRLGAQAHTLMFDIDEELQRAEDCIKTLFYLGKKSDMARRVADVLSEALSAAKRPLDGYAATTGNQSAQQHEDGDGHGSEYGLGSGNSMGPGFGGFGNGNMGGNGPDRMGTNGNGMMFEGMGAFNQRDFMGMPVPST